MPRSPVRPAAALVAVAASVLFGVVGAQATSSQVQPRVVFVTDPCTEQNFLCGPFVQAVRRTGVSGRIVSPDVREDPVDTLSLLARQGYDLIVVDFNWGDPLVKVAPKYPRTRFAIVDIPLPWVTRSPPPNARTILIRTHEAAFLAGWLAAQMEQRREGEDVVGVVAGWSMPPVNDFVIGFRAGARHASEKVKVLVGRSTDFADENKCEAIARSQIARGAGVVFNVAGRCGWGTMRVTGRSGVWAIGVDRDQSSFGRHVLTSVIKRFDVLFAKLLREVKAGRIATQETTMLGLRQRGAALAPINRKVPSELRRAVARLESRIAAGEITVPGASYG